jgi:hypothetical protein
VTTPRNRGAVLAVLAVLVLLPVLGAAPPAVQAAGPSREPVELGERRPASTVTIDIRPSRAIPGESVDVRAGVSPAAPRRVVLQRRSQGRWVKVAAARASREGVHVFRRTTPRTDRMFRVRAPRATIRGTTYAADVSPRRTLLAQRQSVVLRAPSEGVAGDPMLVYAEAFPRRQGRPVALERRRDAGWETVEVHAQNGRGEVAWSPVFDEPGVIVLRATVLAHEGAAAVRSLTVSTTITPAD